MTQPDDGKGFQQLVAGIIILGLILGTGLLWLESTRFLDWSADTQTIVISSTATAENCDSAVTVSDGACNQRVAVIDTGDVILIAVAVFLIVGAFANVVIIGLM